MKLLTALFLTCLALNCRAAEWLTDYQTALRKAKAEKKAVLMDFTGSDWCFWCKKLKAEVFDQPEFMRFAEKNLVLLEVDFPHQKPQSNTARQANEALAERFGVEGYPTVFFLDADGKPLARGGYMEGGPNAYIKAVSEIPGFKWQVAQPKPEAESKAPAKPAAKPMDEPVQQALSYAPPPKFDDLHLKVILGGAKKLALINNATFAQGDKASMKLADKTVEVKCLEIREKSVLVQVEGEKAPRELVLEKKSAAKTPEK